MAIVSISRGSNSFGAEVAEKTAARLGYRCIARETVLETAGLYNIPEADLIAGLDHPPTFLERRVGSRDNYVGALEATLLRHFSQDDVVYHGFAGHYFARNIAGALKVRILAELPDRLAAAVKRDHLSEAEALRLLRRRDKARRKWGKYLYGMDPADPSLYDIILHVGKMSVDGAAAIISTLAQNETFHTSEDIRRALGDQALAASVRALLTDQVFEFDITEITSTDGDVTVRIQELGFAGRGAGSMELARRRRALRQMIQARAKNLPGLRKLSVEHAASPE